MTSHFGQKRSAGGGNNGYCNHYQSGRGNSSSSGTKKRRLFPPGPGPNSSSSSSTSTNNGHRRSEVKVNVVRLDEPSLASHVVSLDCEFVGTGPRGSVSALGRASVLNERGDVLVDVMCRPDEPVTDYRTRWSGIRPSDMHRGLPFDSVQDLVRRAVRGRILIGHALHNDLRVLRLHHPEGLVRDTSRCSLLQSRAGLPPQGNRPASLRSLALALLGLRIQSGEHDSVEDADACLRLYQLVAADWEAELAVRPPQLSSLASSSLVAEPNGYEEGASSSSADAAVARQPEQQQQQELQLMQRRQQMRLEQLSYGNAASAARLTGRRPLRPGFVGTWQAGEVDGLLLDDKYWGSS